ncbi:MAG: NapC/NirT family cytochrome c, partial [Thiohalomonadales bacterium]
MIKLEAIRRFFTVRVIAILGSLALGFMLFGAVSVTVWEYTNSDAFCANACHGVHPEEPAAHEISRHANVNCVECHLGRLSFFPQFFSKAKEVVHIWNYATSNFGRPTTSPTLAASELSCKRCHSSQPHRNNKLKV